MNQKVGLWLAPRIKILYSLKVFLLFLGLTLCVNINIHAATITRPKLESVKSLSYSSLKITWSKVKSADGYVIYRKNDNGSYKKIGSTKKRYYIDKNLICGSKYTYTVRAYLSSDGKRIYSTYVKKGISGKPIPEKPTGVTAISNDSSIELSWNQVPGASGYIILRSVDGSYFSTLKKITGKNNTEYVDDNLKNGEYFYKVLAFRKTSGKTVNGVKSGAASCVVNIITDSRKSFTEFGIAVSQITTEDSIPSGPAAAAANEFYTCRLIVKANKSGVSFDEYKPANVIAGPENYYVLSFKNSKKTKDAYARLCNDLRVIYVEPDAYIDGGSETDEEQSADAYSWGVSVIGADRFANYIKDVIKSQVTVAVVDSGIGNHSQLNPHVKKGYDFIDGDREPTDLNGHGTHVSGIIVDCMPGIDVTILAVRVLNNMGRGSTLGVANGVRYAVEAGAQVINLSLGGGHSQYLDDAIHFANNKNVTVVVAAGNDSKNTMNTCPAHLTNAIVVGAVDGRKIRANFSNFGSSLDLVAPGVSVLSTYPGNRLVTMDGTSMATPHISAIAAMIKMVNPSYTPAKVEDVIKGICDDLGSTGFDAYYGYGIPNLDKLIKRNDPTGIVLNKNEISLSAGDKVKIIATVEPSNANNKNVIWTIDNSEIASADGGIITGKKAGTTTVTAKTINGHTAKCIITVIAAENDDDIHLNHSTLDLGIGEVNTLAVKSSSKVSWSSKSPIIAEVYEGQVIGVSAGTTTITARNEAGKEATCSVTVTNDIPYNKWEAAGAIVHYFEELRNDKLDPLFGAGYITSDDILDMIHVGKDMGWLGLTVNRRFIFSTGVSRSDLIGEITEKSVYYKKFEYVFKSNYYCEYQEYYGEPRVFWKKLRYETDENDWYDDYYLREFDGEHYLYTEFGKSSYKIEDNEFDRLVSQIKSKNKLCTIELKPNTPKNRFEFLKMYLSIL